MNWPLVFIEMKQKKIKMADSKKTHFPAPPILNNFSSNFHGWDPVTPS